MQIQRNADLLIVLLMLAMATACGDAEETPSEETRSEEGPPDEAPTPEVLGETPAGEPPAGEPDGPSNEAMARGMAQMTAALEAASNAEGDTPCEQSYNGLLAMFEAMPDGPDTQRRGALPDRDLFVGECGSLPEETQRCLNPGYGMQHPECAPAMQSPEAAAFRARVSGRPAEAPPTGARPPGLPPQGAQVAQPSPMPPSEGDTPCEQAFNGMRRMFESMRDAPPGARMPEQAVFITACLALPAETQRCVDPAYGMGHPECIQRLGTPEALAFRAALQGGN